MTWTEKPDNERRFVVDVETGQPMELRDCVVGRRYWEYMPDGQPTSDRRPWICYEAPVRNEGRSGWKVVVDVADDGFPLAEPRGPASEWRGASK